MSTFVFAQCVSNNSLHLFYSFVFTVLVQHFTYFLCTVCVCDFFYVHIQRPFFLLLLLLCDRVRKPSVGSTRSPGLVSPTVKIWNRVKKLLRRCIIVIVRKQPSKKKKKLSRSEWRVQTHFLSRCFMPKSPDTIPNISPQQLISGRTPGQRQTSCRSRSRHWAGGGGRGGGKKKTKKNKPRHVRRRHRLRLFAINHLIISSGSFLLSVIQPSAWINTLQEL